MVSLFPAKTFLKVVRTAYVSTFAQTLADLKPQFVRFPGGCVAHGKGIDNIYDWKGSIGPLEARKPLFNLWGYHQTRGLGYHEYFLFCEDIGAEPLPIVAAGVPCQNSLSTPTIPHERHYRYMGQQCGVPWKKWSNILRIFSTLSNTLTVVLIPNGALNRAAAGHPEPFNLKYIGIGNEDLVSEVCSSRASR